MDRTVVVVLGAKEIGDVPGLSGVSNEAEIRLVNGTDELRDGIRGAEVVLGWNFRSSLEAAWDQAGTLRWIHCGGAGVDAVLFPALVESDVALTNARGVFDRAMAEYVLGLVLAFPKRFQETFALQTRGEWRHRLTRLLHGRRALVVGAGSIGREIGRLLAAVGVEVSGLARHRRADDPDFGTVHPRAALDAVLPEFDYVIAVAPRTPETRRMFGAAQFRAMRTSACFVNVGRGWSVDEAALVEALQSGQIAGAALDVFETEPLPATSPLWSLPGVIVSPHMSGDFVEYPEAIAQGFLENFRRFRAGEPLLNMVDKRAGY